MSAQPITYDSLKKALAQGNYYPVNFLHGEEGYYIDEFVKLFEQIIPEADRDIALTNVYAPEVAKPQAIIDMCRRIPMMTDRQVIILREAQNASASFLDKLAPYVKEPVATTVLVIASRGEKMKGKALLKAAMKDSAVEYESTKVWPSQLPKLIADYVGRKKMSIEPKAAEMLADFIGTDLSRLFNEIDKLEQILGKNAMVTPEAVERNIGISKDYNNFELVDAVAARDFAKMMRIVRYFEANPRQNPFTLTSASLFNLFADILQGYYTADKSDRGLQVALGLRNTPSLIRLRRGMNNYNAFQAIEILDSIRRYDAMSKGSGSRQDPYKMLADLMYHIISAPGKLPV